MVYFPLVMFLFVLSKQTITQGCASIGIGAVGTNQQLVRMLSAFADQDGIQLNRTIGGARELLIKSMVTTSTESASNLYPMLVQLQALVEIEDLFQVLSQDACSTTVKVAGGNQELGGVLQFAEMKRRWQCREETSEPSWSMSMALLQILRRM